MYDGAAGTTALQKRQCIANGSNAITELFCWMHTKDMMIRRHLESRRLALADEKRKRSTFPGRLKEHCFAFAFNILLRPFSHASNRWRSGRKKGRLGAALSIFVMHMFRNI